MENASSITVVPAPMEVVQNALLGASAGMSDAELRELPADRLADMANTLERDINAADILVRLQQGKVLAAAKRALHDKTQGYEDFKNWSDYVAKKVSFSYSLAEYYVGAYEHLRDNAVPFEKVLALGDWSHLKESYKALTAKTVEKLVPQFAAMPINGDNRLSTYKAIVAAKSKTHVLAGKASQASAAAKKTAAPKSVPAVAGAPTDEQLATLFTGLGAQRVAKIIKQAGMAAKVMEALAPAVPATPTPPSVKAAVAKPGQITIKTAPAAANAMV